MSSEDSPLRIEISSTTRLIYDRVDVGEIKHVSPCRTRHDETPLLPAKE